MDNTRLTLAELEIRIEMLNHRACLWLRAAIWLTVVFGLSAPAIVGRIFWAGYSEGLGYSLLGLAVAPVCCLARRECLISAVNHLRDLHFIRTAP